MDDKGKSGRNGPAGSKAEPHGSLHLAWAPGEVTFQAQLLGWLWVLSSLSWSFIQGMDPGWIRKYLLSPRFLPVPSSKKVRLRTERASLRNLDFSI